MKSREELMQELTTLREVSAELEKITASNDLEKGLNDLLNRYRNHTHSLGNKVMMVDCANLGLLDNTAT